MAEDGERSVWGIISRACSYVHLLSTRSEQYGTDVNFLKCTCTQGRFSSAQMPISGFTPVRRPILYGTKSNFWNGYRTDGVICSAQIMVCEIPTV